ncbi:MAG: hypothetical protein ABL914_12685, partial [Novosphingobium sp.]|uniref:hypothetical protein n=1 Tax=Novosphingobium sp. TaxID=1874826 RepID=UPI0032B8D3C0
RLLPLALLLLATLPRLPAKPLPTLLRRCNLRRTANDLGRGGNLAPLFIGAGPVHCLTDLIARLNFPSNAGRSALE